MQERVCIFESVWSGLPWVESPKRPECPEVAHNQQLEVEGRNIIGDSLGACPLWTRGSSSLWLSAKAQKVSQVHVLQALGCRRPCPMSNPCWFTAAAHGRKSSMEDSLQLIFSHSGSVLIAGEQILPHLGPSLLSLSSSPASRAHEAHTSRGCNVHKGLSTKQELNLREAKSAPVSFGIALTWVFPGGASGKEPSCHCRRCKRHGFHPWVGNIPWRRK